MADFNANIELKIMSGAEFQLLDKRSVEVVHHYDKAIKMDPVRAYSVGNLPDYAPSPISIVESNLTVLGAPGKIYTTIGISNYDMSYPEKPTNEIKEHRVELIAYSRKANVELAKLLVNLALNPIRVGAFLGQNHGIKLTDDSGVIQGSPLSCAILSIPILENYQALSHIHFKDGSLAEVLWVIPLYSDEYDFFKQSGIRELFQLFIDNQVDLADLERSPVNLPF